MRVPHVCHTMFEDTLVLNQNICGCDTHVALDVVSFDWLAKTIGTWWWCLFTMYQCGLSTS